MVVSARVQFVRILFTRNTAKNGFFLRGKSNKTQQSIIIFTREFRVPTANAYNVHVTYNVYIYI